jgi:hypothetical protein
MEALANNQNSYLQQICNQSERIIRKIGPTQAVADRSKEKCDLKKGTIKYHGTKPPEPVAVTELEHNGTATEPGIASPTNSTVKDVSIVASSATNGSEHVDHSTEDTSPSSGGGVDADAGLSASGGVRRYLRGNDAS